MSPLLSPPRPPRRIRFARLGWGALLIALWLCPSGAWSSEGGKDAQAAAAAPRYAATAGAAGWYDITASFPSLAGEALSIRFALPQTAGDVSMREFGVSQDEIDALRDTCLRTEGCAQDEFDRRLLRYFQEHKLRLRKAAGAPSSLFVDIPAVVRRNRVHVQGLAGALQQLGAERGQGAGWVFEAAVALVQSGLEYRRPQALDGGRQTLGFYTPARALEKGYGDCDTKSALLAAILMNLGESRLIGVRVPNHYLLGVARAPREGELHLDYRGEPFVLIEAAGPAQRRPGAVAQRTQQALADGAELRIDPMF